MGDRVKVTLPDGAELWVTDEERRIFLALAGSPDLLSHFAAMLRDRYRIRSEN